MSGEDVRAEFDRQVEALKADALLSTDARVVGKLIAASDPKVRQAVLEQLDAGLAVQGLKARGSPSAPGAVEVRFELASRDARVTFSPEAIVALVEVDTRRVLSVGRSKDAAQSTPRVVPFTMMRPASPRRITARRAARDELVRDFLADRLTGRIRFWPTLPGGGPAVIMTEPTMTSTEDVVETETLCNDPNGELVVDDSGADSIPDEQQDDSPDEPVPPMGGPIGPDWI